MSATSLPRPTRHKVAAAATALSPALCLAWLLASATELFQAPFWADCSVAALLVAIVAVLLRKLQKARRDAAQAASQCAELQRRLECDPLTKLMNRTAFNKALDELRSLHSAPGAVMVLFFDLDRFKEVNDTLGHRVGDQLLIEVACRAGSVLGDAIAFARLGGDEFAAILPAQDSASAQAFGDKIVKLMSEPFVIDELSINVAASVGIALGDAVLDDGHELLRRADAAMYEAKGAARGRCHIFDEMLSGRQIQESFLRIELGKSLVEQNFSLHFQPLVDCRTGQIRSAEALLRATAPTLQNADTATLISVTEKTGQIIALSDWTIEAAFSAIRSLETLPIALNISPIYFRQSQFVPSLVERLLQTRTPPELLTIEITEGVLIADIAAARESISQLREIGVKVYLDDFGTCYSSLSYLQHFELDALKLDKSFLHNIADRKKATQVIKSIIDFGHSLDMRVVVEGVESDWQARLLQLLGCDLLQGYFVGVPVPLEAMRDLLSRSPSATPTPATGTDATGDAEGAGRPALYR